MIATRVTQTALAAGVAAGLIWGTGSNQGGELGLGDQVDLTDTSTLHPTEPVIDRPTAVAASYHSLALDASGSVWAWGLNQHGELGLGPGPVGQLFYSPHKVGGPAGVIAISAGWDHSLPLHADGTVWAWGANDFGQLGDGTTATQPAPVHVKVLTGKVLTGVIAVSAGYGFSLALQLNGMVWSWGVNANGQLGDGKKKNRTTPGVIKGLDQIAVISASKFGEHSLALRADGTIWAWGMNDHGQLGVGTTIDHPIPYPAPSPTDAIGIAAGARHSLALRANGVVEATGLNDAGQLGDGTTDEHHGFEAVTVPEGDDPEPNIPLRQVVEVAAGAEATPAGEWLGRRSAALLVVRVRRLSVTRRSSTARWASRTSRCASSDRVCRKSRFPIRTG
jgi:alpha-tubulin suppressor-like RCC1 family protein